MAKKKGEDQKSQEETKKKAKSSGSDPVITNIVIKPLRRMQIGLKLTGASPYMQSRFSKKALEMIRIAHEAGSRSKSKKVRESRDFEAECHGAAYRFKDGGYGIPCSAFRNAAISACRIVGFKMTIAKMSIFIVADGYDDEDGTPLVRLNAGEPEMTVKAVRNTNGVADLRSRPQWREWTVDLRVQFDGDQFSPDDVYNLFTRIGQQVGVGEGRHDSKSSAGQGLGTFTVEPLDHA